MADHEHKCERYCLWHVRIPWVREVVGVTGPARAVLWVLAVVYANGETGLAWPGVVTLARESGLSRWTVGRALDDLLAIGAVEIVGRKHRKATTYRVRFDLDASTVGSRQLPTEHEAPTGLVAECTKLVAESGANPLITMGGESLADLDETSLAVSEETARREANGTWAVGPFRFPLNPNRGNAAGR